MVIQLPFMSAKNQWRELGNRACWFSQPCLQQPLCSHRETGDLPITGGKECYSLLGICVWICWGVLELKGLGGARGCASWSPGAPSPSQSLTHWLYWD